MHGRHEIINRLFQHLNAHLDPEIKRRLPDVVLSAILHCIADLYLNDRTQMAIEIARDISRPKPTPRNTPEHDDAALFIDELEKL